MPETRRIQDLVPRTALGAQEIGFALPDRYNASEILYRNRDGDGSARTAIHCEGVATSYGTLCALASQIGNGLADLGLQRGDRVLVLLDDRAEFAALFFGAMRAGFVPVLVNTLSSADLLTFYLNDTEAPVVVVEAALVATLAEAAQTAAGICQIVVVGDPPEELPAIGWDALVGGASDDLEVTDTGRDDMAFWMYSSGSTGRPKGVVHLHHDLAYTHAAYGEAVLGIRPDDVVFSVPKLFFAYGLGNSLTFPFSVGAAVVLQPGRPEPGAIFETIERTRPSLFFAVPTLYVAMLAHDGGAARDLSSLRLCISAAEVLPGETFHAWRRRYGVAIMEGLGSTEVLHIYLSNLPDQMRLGSAGRRVPGYEIALKDPDGTEVAPGAAGVLWVRGDSSAPQYWNRPDKTAETMRDGWIYTGDRFRQDADGFLHFEGRADELVKVSGQWVHPLEIERCLAEHPAVHECAVVAIEDGRGLTITRAHVVLQGDHTPGPDTRALLQSFVKTTLLPYKSPREIVFADSLPKTGTDKIDRQRLKQDRVGSP